MASSWLEGRKEGREMRVGVLAPLSVTPVNCCRTDSYFVLCIVVVLDTSHTLEIVSPDTVISHQLMKRVWPSVQRDTCFASHIRKLDLSSQGTTSINNWICSNFSVDHPKAVSYHR